MNIGTKNFDLKISISKNIGLDWWSVCSVQFDVCRLCIFWHMNWNSHWKKSVTKCERVRDWNAMQAQPYTVHAHMAKWKWNWNWNRCHICLPYITYTAILFGSFFYTLPINCWFDRHNFCIQTEFYFFWFLLATWKKKILCALKKIEICKKQNKKI